MAITSNTFEFEALGLPACKAKNLIVARVRFHVNSRHGLSLEKAANSVKSYLHANLQTSFNPFLQLNSGEVRPIYYHTSILVCARWAGFASVRVWSSSPRPVASCIQHEICYKCATKSLERVNTQPSESAYLVTTLLLP